jgi:hypothetical protein
MRLLHALPVVALVALMGCETYYKKPESTHTARVRFTGASSNHTILVTQYMSSKCDLGESGGIMGVVGGINRDPLGNVPPYIKEAGNTQQMIGYSESAGVLPIERVVAADRDFIFTIYRMVDIRLETPYIKTKTCTVTYQLTPQPGEQYEIAYSEDTHSCRADAAKLQLASNVAVKRWPEPSFRKAPQQCSGMGAVK